VPAERSRKVVRSYSLVFRRRWRIFKIQNWRIPLPNGLELRTVGYWLCSLVAIAALGRVPVIGLVVGAIPESVRLLGMPMVAAWGLSQWEVDGRSPHRALIGVVGHCLRPHDLSGLRRCPPEGSELALVEQVAGAPDLGGPEYPRGRVVGPATLLLRYPVAVVLEGVPRGAGAGAEEQMASAHVWRLRKAPGATPLHTGKTVRIPVGRVVVFE
jgi:conjugation transfer TcpE-like protein